MDFLRNEVGFVIVTIPEALAIEQLDGIFDEFNEHGLKVEQLVINNVITDTSSEFLCARASQQRNYIDVLIKKYSNLKMVELPMFPHEIKGMGRLEGIQSKLFS